MYKALHRDNLSNLQFIDVSCYEYSKEEKKRIE